MIRILLSIAAVGILAGLTGCAALKPVPQQTLTCVKNEASASNAVGAATCIASNSQTSALEACFLGMGERVGLDVLQCEALAIWGDLQHAKQVAAANGADTAVVQANAVAYLQAKGTLNVVPAIAVPSSTNPSP